MMFNRETLFAGLKTALKPTGFNDLQVTAIAEIVSEFERRKLPDVRWLAYILATVWHEARFISQPEIGRGKGKKYGLHLNEAGNDEFAQAFIERVAGIGG